MSWVSNWDGVDNSNNADFTVADEDITVNGVTRSLLTINGDSVKVNAVSEFTIEVEGGTFTVNTQLEVFTVAISTLEVQVGYASTLTCSVASISQTPSIKWTERENTYVMDGAHNGFTVTNDFATAGQAQSKLAIAADKVRLF